MVVYDYDPVCGKYLGNSGDVYIKVTRKLRGTYAVYKLCCPECHSKFEKNESKYKRLARKLQQNAEDREAGLQVDDY